MTTKILAFLLALTTALLSLTARINTVKAPADDSDFVPVVRFVEMSDTHISAVGDVRCGRIQKILSMAYDDARQDPQYTTLDAAVFAGDLTDDGRVDEFIGFTGAVNSALRDETQLLAVVAKSHDGKTMDKKSLSLYEQLTGVPSDYHYVIRGFHFIGISASKTKGEHYSEYQKTWLREQLAAAAADDPNKPIFVTHHEHVLNTVYGSSSLDGWGMDTFLDVLSDYPQVIDFSGHSHYPLNDPRSIWQGAFTAVGTGAVYYAEFTVDQETSVHPEQCKQIAQAWIVEADKENTIRLRGYDALTGTLLCTYYVHDPANADAREYTPAQQQAKASAPVFADGASLSVRRTGGSKYRVSFPAPQSTDGEIVFLYRVRVTDANGQETYKSYKVNNYWRGQCYDTVTMTVQAEKGSTVSVTAENAYGMRTAALTSQIA